MTTVQKTLSKKFFVVFGMAGAGKGTFVDALKKAIPNLFWSDTGLRFRAAIAGELNAVILNSQNQERMRKINDSGKLQPSGLAATMVIQFFLQHYAGQQFAVIDGSPRREFELYALHEFFTEFYDAEVHFVYIFVDEHVATQRMIDRHKVAPRPETSTPGRIKTRIDEFTWKIAPTMNIAGKKYSDKFYVIDNNGSQGEFHKHIDTFIKEHMTV